MLPKRLCSAHMFSPFSNTMLGNIHADGHCNEARSRLMFLLWLFRGWDQKMKEEDDNNGCTQSPHSNDHVHSSLLISHSWVAYFCNFNWLFHCNLKHQIMFSISSFCYFFHVSIILKGLRQYFMYCACGRVCVVHHYNYNKNSWPGRLAILLCYY